MNAFFQFNEMSQEEDIEVFPPCPDEDNPAEVEWEFITSGNLSYLFSSSWFSFFSFHCFLGKSKYPILTTHGGFFKYGINRTNIDTGRTWYACSHKRSHKCRATVLTKSLIFIMNTKFTAQAIVQTTTTSPEEDGEPVEEKVLVQVSSFEVVCFFIW